MAQDALEVRREAVGKNSKGGKRGKLTRQVQN